MTVIVDYGCGNPSSIRNMLKRLGHSSRISANPRDVLAADRIILPGVGSFDYGIARVRELGLAPALNRAVIEQGKPILGICIGLQLMCRRSEEGKMPGLGWIEADVVRFDQNRMLGGEKTPHMGWADIEVHQNTEMFMGFSERPRFYFAHSYHVRCDKPQDIAATAVHGYEFVAAIARENIAGVQFHPEKSHVFGLELLGRFVTQFGEQA